MFAVGTYVQVVNHSDEGCSGQYGMVTLVELAYNGRTLFYTVELQDSMQLCMCTEDELMEG